MRIPALVAVAALGALALTACAAATPSTTSEPVAIADLNLDAANATAEEIRGKGGEITKRVPVPIDRGYWSHGASAEKGDVFTENGCVWIALRDTKAKPCHENAADWRLMVRKGRDGIDGRNGRDLGLVDVGADDLLVDQAAQFSERISR